MKTVSIITVNFNQPEVTIDFLKSVKSNLLSPGVEVVLVDNGSEVFHEAEFKSVYPELIYIRSEKNLGFAGGNNLALEAAKGDYLLFLNNDTEVTANLCEVLTSALDDDPQIGIISPMLLYFDQPDLVQYAGFSPMNYLTGRNKDLGRLQQDHGQYNEVSMETGYCHGAAMMCRSADLEEIGRMSDAFFLYYEELDWCEHFKRAGKKIWFTGKTRVYHKESISVGKESPIKTYFMTRNRMLFIRRNSNLVNTLAFSIYFIFIASTKQVLTYVVKGRIDLAKWVLKGVWWNLTHSKNSKNLGFKIQNRS
ncbi:glycosyltransferase family 2 protein [Pedobacter sp. MC2016-24]|uniref:glycosyltransferase family 2 protein n=1 Tax=Pedobacter sp. MC2016-24 TaxID=2780090 RepID=UPI001882C418|nr:glycosyltransferase family 2 protein [Pedobacter sp. MC2016-24]MBE9602503.1 glycosyltransferase family 2 protein [Pedobacter sp. MC2016-24]